MKTINLLLLSVVFMCLTHSCNDDDTDTNTDDETITDVESDTASNLIEHTYTKNQGPDKNPLKGWNSSWWNDRDYASVGFQYVSWENFEPTNNSFDFEAVEDIINRPGTNGKHIVLRLYCDWYGEDFESDGPRWLYEEEGVARLQDSDGQYLTDFNDENYIREAIEAIQALANHYDDDPRIYSFQIGILGYWGEWHTAGFSDDYQISDDSFNQILNTYKNSFSTARIMGRYPWREPLASTGGIGFHNDFFGPNGHSDEFDETVFASNKWLDGPIGGEMPPDWGAAEFNEMFATSRGMDMIETGHYATMSSSNQPCDEDPNGSNCEGFMEMHRRMGYNYQIEKAIFPEVISNSDSFSIQLLGDNIGVAPMYYNWDVQFALINQDNQPVAIFETTNDLRTIVDTSEFDFSISSDINDISIGSYRIGVRIIQPNADQTKTEEWGLDARNTYILFSNELAIIDGYWDTENKLQGGWSILGDVMIE